MRRILKISAAVLLMVCLTVVALGIGSVKGWQREKMKVEESANSLLDVLQTRLESANNVLTVARRHLSGSDAAVQAVVRDRDVLNSGAALEEKLNASAKLTEDANALLKKLANQSSVHQDTRDLMYVQDYLPQMLSESQERTAGAYYNAAVRNYNEGLKNSWTGRIARVFGAKEMPELSVQ